MMEFRDAKYGQQKVDGQLTGKRAVKKDGTAEKFRQMQPTPKQQPKQRKAPRVITTAALMLAMLVCFGCATTTKNRIAQGWAGIDSAKNLAAELYNAEVISPETMLEVNDSIIVAKTSLEAIEAQWRMGGEIENDLIGVLSLIDGILERLIIYEELWNGPDATHGRNHSGKSWIASTDQTSRARTHQRRHQRRAIQRHQKPGTRKPAIRRGGIRRASPAWTMKV